MIRKITAIFLLFCSTSVAFAQVDDQEKLKKENESKIKKANDLYGKYAYVDAIKIYERIAEQGYVDQNILENLGNSYYSQTLKKIAKTTKLLQNTTIVMHNALNR